MSSETEAGGRRIQRVRHDIRRRTLTVASAEPMGANFVRVTLEGPELEGFLSLGFDDHLKFIVDPAAEPPVMRDFTPLRYDAERGTLVIDFFIHEGGAASAWARSATPGTAAHIGGPRGSMIVPMDYAWHLLVGDETALPAMDRRLAELPAGTSVIVIAKVSDPADRRRFETAASVDVRWLGGADDLAEAVRALEMPSGEGFAWCGAEAADMVAVRTVLLKEKGHPLDHMRASSYWRAPGTPEDVE